MLQHCQRKSSSKESEEKSICLHNAFGFALFCMDEQQQENKSDTNHEFASILTKTKNFELDVNELKESVQKLSLELEKSQSQCKMQQSELSSKTERIAAIEKLYEQCANDLNESRHANDLKNEQISTLKNTIKNFEQILDKMNKEKSDLVTLTAANSETISAIEKEKDRLKEQLNDAFSKNILEHPEYKTLLSKYEELTTNYNEENKGRLAALSAWQKSEQSFQTLEKEFQEQIHVHSKIHKKMGAFTCCLSFFYRCFMKTINQQNTQNLKELEWERLRNKNITETNEKIQQELATLQQESLQLKIRLGTVESQLVSNNEMEKVRMQTVAENINTEMKWRQHVLVQQIKQLQIEVQDANFQKLKLQKTLKQLEIEYVNEKLQKNSNNSENNFVSSPSNQDKKAITHNNKTSNQPKSLVVFNNNNSGHTNNRNNQFNQSHPSLFPSDAMATKVFNDLDDLDEQIMRLKREIQEKTTALITIFSHQNIYFFLQLTLTKKLDITDNKILHSPMRSNYLSHGTNTFYAKAQSTSAGNNSIMSNSNKIQQVPQTVSNSRYPEHLEREQSVADNQCTANGDDFWKSDETSMPAKNENKDVPRTLPGVNEKKQNNTTSNKSNVSVPPAKYKPLINSNNINQDNARRGQKIYDDDASKPRWRF
ncbi:hypothetical protein RFI_14687 [Reticulomyxa filosa]|uniref:Uncharacterized protein n=1 Tax=Reticulomyxa filosa TaxID=46433 RepID=X6N8A6_RETFI|nr:hypothetical protein RFI_14687 [Reticulomyxa filosa]|eukprot:ETO22510.1 hypothetical protein RFI_14687 [Reticulomyxa filosa]